MVWDRWDDAMDDIRDERYDLNREIERLESRLRELGIPLPPEQETKPPEPVQENDTISFADRAHSEVYYDLLSRRARLEQLRKLFEEHGP